MNKLHWLLLMIICLFLGGLLLVGQVTLVQAADFQQQPTVSIATVTGTPRGALVRVNNDQDQVNVRTGPGLDYPEIGILIAGQEVSAVGRSPGGDWIQILYPGTVSGLAWVYAPLVSIPTETLPIVAPPPTPTPRTTPTTDPTLIGQFNLEATATRLPTFTAAPPIAYPTFENQSGGFASNLPVGMLIVGLAVIGIFGALLSLIRGR